MDKNYHQNKTFKASQFFNSNQSNNSKTFNNIMNMSTHNAIKNNDQIQTTINHTNIIHNHHLNSKHTDNAQLNNSSVKVKKAFSQPNLFVVRNGKLCQRTPKNNGQNSPNNSINKSTTKIIRVNHTINHIINPKQEELQKQKQIINKNKSNSFFNTNNKTHQSIFQKSPYTKYKNNLSNSRRVILNDNALIGTNTNQNNQQKNTQQQSSLQLNLQVNYYLQTIQDLNKQLQRLKKDYQELQKQHWNLLNNKLQLISQDNTFSYKYPQKVQQCLRAIQKIQEHSNYYNSPYKVPKTKMNIHKHDFVYNKLGFKQRRNNDNRRNITQTEVQDDTIHLENQLQNQYYKKLNKSFIKNQYPNEEYLSPAKKIINPFSKSIVVSDVSCNVPEQNDFQNYLQKEKKINNNLKSLNQLYYFSQQKNRGVIESPTSQLQSQQQQLRYLLEQRVKAVQNLAKQIIQQHKQLLKKLIYFKQKSFQFEKQIIQINEKHLKDIKKYEDQLYFYKTECQLKYSYQGNNQGLKTELKRKQELIQSLMKRLKIKAQNQYGYHYAK